MAEIVAIMVVGPLLSMVKEKASSYLLDQYKVMEGMEDQHEVLKRKLPAILDVVTDAEEQAAKHREGAKSWLEAVRKVAYKANDVLDEFKYEALRRKAKADGHYNMDVRKVVRSHNRFVFRHRMANKLRNILQEIDVLIAEMNTFRFQFKQQPPMPMQWRHTDASIPTDCVEIASKSRAQEKKHLVDRLLAQAKSTDLTILPIVGMGGLGKTTLAQLVYNDPEMQKHFELRLWVCVSENFDVNSLADRIVKEAENNSRRRGQVTASDENGHQVAATAREEEDNGHHVTTTGSELNGHQMCGNSALIKLQDEVKGKKYLLVLDDVWNRDEPRKWEKLKSYLQHGGSGSSVLITTRDEAVAKLMMGTRTIEGACKLGGLDEESISQIIKTRAFGSKQEKEWPGELVNMVGEVAKRCKDSGCSNLGELQKLDLGGRLEDAQNNNHEEVVEGLKANDRLRVLRIRSYGSSTLPKWLTTLRGMVELVLSGCKKLEKLPELWQLPALQILRLERLESLHCLCRDGKTAITFPELKVLTLYNMPQFEAWWDTDDVQGEEPIFPKVEELEIEHCGSLTALPKAASVEVDTNKCRSAFPALRKMKLHNLDTFNKWEAVEGTDGEELEDLSISECDALEYWPENVFKVLASLRKLSIVWCSKLTGHTQASDEQSAPAPEQDCDKIESLPPSLRSRLDYLEEKDLDARYEV
nr:unnamed protein product [Digitaria exilis]